ncbi:MAG: type II toxin-antitoxin system HigB family toxin [Candidatus Delongbacteria bacterium]|jgi:mRNA interferase HigB|nr:type II toxin-antitoxin system HigB family toxin [Candidatus Delongbacteria bacterium]
MNVIKLKTIKDYYEKNNQCKQQLLTWYQEVTKAEWNNSHDIKEKYPSASFIHDNLVVFNIKGKKYRLIVKVAYKKKAVLIKFIGTHPEYDKWIKKNL